MQLTSVCPHYILRKPILTGNPNIIFLKSILMSKLNLRLTLNLIIYKIQPNRD